MSENNRIIDSFNNLDNKDDEIIPVLKPEDKDKKISYEIGYLVPFWSSKPIHKYFLEVWREGAIINTIDVSSKEYYLIGRNKSIVDIYQNNITVSRVHVIIQHKDDGELYIYDMDSVYGTSINKKMITKKTYVKLNVGDTFKLGKSGKMFIVNGPSELLPEEDSKPINLIGRKELMKKREDQIREQYEQRENYKRNLLGVNRSDTDWGQKDFDEEIQRNQKEDEDSDKEKEIDYYGPLKLEEIKTRKDLSEKQKNLIDKLESTLKNINKLKDEIIKIQKKEFESGELTDGQKKRVEMNEKKLISAYERSELLEDNLRVSLSSKDGVTNTEQKFDKKIAKEMNSDEDEFFDRAKLINTNKDNFKNITITENYETLKSKLEFLMRKRQKIVDKVLKFDESWNAKEKDNEDTLDAFFNETKNKIKNDEKTKLTNLITETNKEISKTQKLISLVTPSHIKIKFKPGEDIINLRKPNNPKKEKFEGENSDEDNDENEDRGFKRDLDALEKEKKKTKILNVFNKMNDKINIESNKKFTESDEEILEGVKQYQENFEKEIKDDIIQIRAEFKKNALKNEVKNDEIKNYPGGLITKKPETKIIEENYFEDIVQNINQDEFDLDKYKQINNILTRKNEQKWNTRGDNDEIDYSKGGLQTFEKKKNEYGLITTSRKNNFDEDENIFDDDKDNNINEFVGHKREREEFNANNPYEEAANNINLKEKHKIYGATFKPKGRNYDEDDEDNDYESRYLPEDKFTIQHDLTKENKYKKDDDLY